MILNFITWNVDPVAISLGPISIRWYGILWAIGIWLTYLTQIKIYKHENLPDTWTDKLFIYVVIGTIIGARLGHCLFYEWHLLPEPVRFLGMTFKYGNPYLTHPWKLLYIWQGGLASHGGAIGILIAGIFINKLFKKGYIWIYDRLVIGICLCGACIRLGNLMNSEIYGNPTTLPWGFLFVRNGDTLPCHPTQIYEMLYCMITFAITWWMYWKKKAYQHTGLIFGVFLIGIFGTRFALEFIKLNQEDFESFMVLNMGQWLSVPFILWGIYLIVNAVIKMKHNKQTA